MGCWIPPTEKSAKSSGPMGPMLSRIPTGSYATTSLHRWRLSSFRVSHTNNTTVSSAYESHRTHEAWAGVLQNLPRCAFKELSPVISLTTVLHCLVTQGFSLHTIHHRHGADQQSAGHGSGDIMSRAAWRTLCVDAVDGLYLKKWHMTRVMFSRLIWFNTLVHNVAPWK